MILLFAIRRRDLPGSGPHVIEQAERLLEAIEAALAEGA
jgi:hypothetical protein